MSSDHPEWNYLFISDLHLSLGYDPERRAYHPREDFFFDEAFFRWLRWADENCTDGRRWELVCVGDTFDFFPVDRAVVAQYFRERERRQQEIDPADPRAVAQYWQRQFSEAAPAEWVPERIQRLIFEDDVLEGRVRLEPLSASRAASMSLGGPRVPDWAAGIYARYRPEAGEADVGLALRAPAERESTAIWIPTEKEPTLTPAERRRQTRARRRDEAFEQRYGFLPNPESSADKLDSIYQGHPLFFRALAWFVGQGHRVVFLRGNHDLEIFWPRVQERLREFIIREYPAAFGIDAEQPLPPGFAERIDFRPGWFYYRRGIFYAEHGCQYELLNACPNPIRPLLPGDEWLLNPDVGGLGVICFHNHLESAFPEWENQGDFAVVLLDLIRRYPFKMLALLVHHVPDFLRLAQRIWLAGREKEKDQEPTEEDCARYAASVDLDTAAVGKIYREGDTPLLLRRPLAWTMFSPGGHIVKILLLLMLVALLIGAGALWYLVAAPALADLIPADLLSAAIGPASQILAKILLWLAPPAVYAIVQRRIQQQHAGPFLFEAARRVHEHLRDQDPDLRYYILGHDHQADTRPMERKGDGHHVYYLNTGTWTPHFAEGKRRLQTLGREVQFTFARLVQDEHGYEAALLRWNDDASRADPQITPPAQPEA
jgi:UDP-2,3-diacylglucosamine pyrophosphatase LpxH